MRGKRIPCLLPVEKQVMRNPLDIIDALHKKALLENSGVNPDALQLPPWPDDMRALPNDWARSALFSVRNKRIPRAALKNAEVFHIHKQVKITFTGIELRAEDDELVWQQIIDYAKPRPLGGLVEFSYYQLCKDLDWPINGRYYQKAEDCLSRLQATAIKITTQRIGTLSLSMIDKFAVVEPGAAKARCQVNIDPRMIYLFAGSHFAQIEWSHYRGLSPISRRLYDYIASHRAPYPIKLEIFRRLCGSDSARSAKWAEQVRNACAEIETAGLVRKAWVEADSICCERY